MPVYRLGDVEPRSARVQRITLDLVPGMAALRPVRQNFVRVAPDPWEIHARQRGLKLPLGQSGDAAIVDGAGVGDGEGDLLACLGSQTFNFSGSPVVGIGATTVFASQKVKGPFVITHLGVRPTQALVAAFSVTWLVSEDNDTSGGFATTGVPVLVASDGGVQRFQLETGWTDFYPDFLWSGADGFIKFVANNTAGVTVGVSFTTEGKIL